MAQLVGRSCTHCSGRISSELDAAFCSCCGQPCHTACKKPTGTEGVGRCALCGANFDPEARAQREAELVSAEQSAKPLQINFLGAAQGAGRLFKLGKYVVGGGAIIFIGIVMMSDQEFRDNPQRFSGGDLARGGAVIVAGIAVFMLGWWSYRNDSRGTRKENGARKDVLLKRFAELLFRNDPLAIAASRKAIAHPAAFIALRGPELGYSRPEPGWTPDSWSVLLDVARLQGWVRVVDWREAPNEVAASVAALAPAAAIPIDWAGLATTHQNLDTRGFLSVLARAMPEVERLISLDDGSDGYPLALLPAASLAEATRLAVEVGGRVDALEDESTS